jgi:predicted nucleotidyltransferase
LYYIDSLQEEVNKLEKENMKLEEEIETNTNKINSFEQAIAKINEHEDVKKCNSNEQEMGIKEANYVLRIAVQDKNPVFTDKKIEVITLETKITEGNLENEEEWNKDNEDSHLIPITLLALLSAKKS